MIVIERKEDCCGCSACMAICPAEAIQMTEDEEGFRYSRIDKEKCINCGKCDRVCPVKNPVPEISQEQNAYLFQLKDKNLRMDSTSGGAFTAIASAILREGGVVFGAAYDEDWQVIHTYVEKESELWRFRNSKYVQSNLRNSFRQVKKFLYEGRKVCFSGTPCQVEGLHKYLNSVDNEQNLILIDLVCRAVPSPLFWKKYVTWQQSRLDRKIGNIRFRDKRHYGYKYSQMVIEDKTGAVIYHNGVESDPYLRAFFDNLIDRPSCYECKFKKRYRVSDMTLWDCFDVGMKHREFDDDIGTTNLLIHSAKGLKMVNNIQNGVKCAIDVDLAINGMRELTHKVNWNPKRSAVMKYMTEHDMNTTINKFFIDTLSIKVKRNIRLLLIKFNIYGEVKKWVLILKKQRNKKQ